MNRKIVIPLATTTVAVLIGLAAILRSGHTDVKPPVSTLPFFVTFRTQGRQLLDPCGKPIILKGVNKLSVFESGDPLGTRYFAAIDSSGANCVRIVWEMQSEGVDNPLARLDSFITHAKAHKLIPIVGLWDYTNTKDGGFSHLDQYAAYWARPDVVKLIKKHQQYLIVNIANEAAKADGLGGDEDSSAHQIVYAQEYIKAIKTIRKAGINVPLMIDGMDRGKSLHCFVAKGPEMLNADPLHNLIFSFHPYWPQSDTDGTTFIKDRFDEVHRMLTPITIVMGELAGFGAGGGTDTVVCSPAGAVDYLQFARLAEPDSIGWLLWEWGPKHKPECVSMDMTADGTYKAVTTSPNKWVRDLAIDQPFSLTSAQKTPFVANGFQPCTTP